MPTVKRFFRFLIARRPCSVRFMRRRGKMWHNERLKFAVQSARCCRSLFWLQSRLLVADSYARNSEERPLACPLCAKRPPRRFCPAKAENICAVCCGTEREVSIDCPSDCSYLVASRQYGLERRELDWSKVPFSEIKISAAFVREHESLLLALSYAICLYARENPSLADADALATLRALAEAYRTLSSGIYYERAPDHRLQRGLYDALKVAIDEHRKGETRGLGPMSVRDSEIRDALVFLTQLSATRSNGRPKGRAYLDFLRTQFKAEEFSKPASNIVLLP